MTAQLNIRNEQLELTENSRISWSIEFKSIQLIGEYTTEGGPFVDDYFFVFVNSNGTLYEVSNDLINYPTFWTKLSSLLNSHLQPKLASSTLFNSRILYPEHLTGEPLFNLVASGTGQLELSEQANGQLKNGDESTY
ncbi:MAG: hypothetical protein RIG77_17420 [Cyclobacteriaceae bacterium]